MQKQGMFVFIDCEQYGLRSLLWPFRVNEGREVHYRMHEMLIRGQGEAPVHLIKILHVHVRLHMANRSNPIHNKF